jgi:hypothetical protein
MESTATEARPAKIRANARNLLLQDLNPNQQKAVQSPSCRVLIIAGAGSGKTEVVARRVAWWIIDQHQLLISGAIDVVRLDDPARVSLMILSPANPGQTPPSA